MTDFEFVEFPAYATAPTLESCGELRAVAAPGEMLSIAFGVRAGGTVAELELGASSPRSGEIELPPDAVDLKIVKVWAQAGVGVYQSSSTLVPELLLEDDRVELRDSYSGWCGHWNHLLQRGRYYQPPRVEAIGGGRTALASGETKQVWLTVRLAESCVPGVYETVITASDGRATRDLRLRLEVLPIRLLEPSQDLFLWYKGTLDCRFPQHYVSPRVFEAQLSDIYAHGFRSISLNEPRAESRRRALEIAKRVGFRRNVILTEPFDEALDPDEYAPLTPVYYLSDELDARGPATVAHHVANWREAKKAGAKSMISLINASSARRFDASGNIGHSPDIFSYYLSANRGHFASNDRASTAAYYYWLSHMEKPLVHRALAGVYLWRSGAAGIAPYCYQHLPQFPNSPFNDFDEWEPGFHVGQERRPFKDHMTTYPSRDGVISTLQWKGLSDGITDLKYLTTLDAAISRALASSSLQAREHASNARARIDAFLDRISLTDIDVVSETNREPYATVAAGEYHAFRLQMARDLVALDANTEAEAPKAGAHV